jgi:hypothetical protein
MLTQDALGVCKELAQPVKPGMSAIMYLYARGKEYFDISFFFNTHEAKKNRQGKDLLARNQVNMSDWSKMFTLLFQRTNTMKSQLLSEQFQNNQHVNPRCFRRMQRACPACQAGHVSDHVFVC